MRLLCTTLPLLLLGAVLIVEHFPEELRRLPQWALWKFIPGKVTPDNPFPKPRKVPFSAFNRTASPTDSSTWSEFSRIFDQYLLLSGWCDGLVFGLIENNGITFIDADNAYPSDAAEIAPWAEGLQTRFADTYQEASVSDTGFHILCHARAPRCGQWSMHHGKAEIGKVEVYDRARFVVMTGAQAADMPHILTDHQRDVERIVMRLTSQKAQWEARYGNHCRPAEHSSPAAPRGGIPPGHRHNELVRRAGHMWKAGMSPEEVEQKLIEINATLCGGHYPDSHIRQIVRSAARWSR
jgi:hypothetical protein